MRDWTELKTLAVRFLLGCAVGAVLILGYQSAFAEQWCGLTVAPEDRCSPYERHEDYTYPRSIERDIVHRAGYEFVTTWSDGWLTEPFPSPYKRNVKVRSIRDTDIEHIVAAAEAHDSGLCAQSPETRTAFARDLDNLTLALPSTNQWDKSDKDPAAWLPEKNVRWYLKTWYKVKAKYGLTVDEAERDAMWKALGDQCP